MKNPIILVVILIIITISGIFILDKISPKSPKTTPGKITTQLANPASVFCAQKKGTNVLFTLGNGAQDGLCQFPDGKACEEWAMMKGQCPVGGISTSGYENMGQRYCAWSGGKTSAAGTACNLPDKHVCSSAALYAGTCN